MRHSTDQDLQLAGPPVVCRPSKKRCLVLGVLSALFMAGGCSESTEPIVREFPVETVTTIDTEPAWSPDGRTIAYRHEWNEIWLLDMETLERRVLTDGCTPAWSPDGGSIAYVGAEDMQNIYVIEVETGAVRKLTNWGRCCYPSWSPDGSRIAFDSWQYIQEYVGEPAQDFRGIWLINPDGTDTVRVTVFEEGGRQPVWSPDGSKLLHRRYLPEWTLASLCVMDTTGNSIVGLTANGRDNRHGCWSADGTKIVWDSTVGGDPASGIWVMNADGSDQHLIQRVGGDATWSPDGSRIVYSGYNEDTDTVTLWIMNADGSDAHPLTLPAG